LVDIVGVGVQELKFISVLGGGNDSQVLTALLLLDVLLGQVLEVSLGEVKLSLNDDAVLVLLDGDLTVEVTSLALDLDSLGEVFLEVRQLDDVVLKGLSALDDELVGLNLFLVTLLNGLGHC